MLIIAILIAWFVAQIPLAMWLGKRLKGPSKNPAEIRDLPMSNTWWRL